MEEKSQLHISGYLDEWVSLTFEELLQPQISSHRIVGAGTSWTLAKNGEPVFLSIAEKLTKLLSSGFPHFPSQSTLNRALTRTQDLRLMV